MRLSFLPIALLAAGCTEQKVTVYNTPPGVSILSPTDGAVIAPGSLIEFWGVVDDSQDAAEDLAISWASSVDGQLGTDPADADGTTYLAVTELTAGTHAITLTAVDGDGESGLATITVEVEYGGTSADGPTVIMTGPAEGSSFLSGEEISFVAAVTDPDQTCDTLDIAVVSDIDGTLWTGNPDAGCTVSAAYTGLSVGDHVVTITATDVDGHVGTDSAGLSVVADGRPTATITSPTAGEEFSTSETVLLEGTVGDVETDTELLSVTWSSDRDGVLGSGAPDSSGYTAGGVVLSEGVHVLTLTVVDADAKEGTDSVAVTVIDGNNVDDDGDGYTENEGDCADDDPRTNPGAAELCDTADNDCDGETNEDFADSYEANETYGTAYDVGEVDDEFIGSDSVTISGLTLHNEDDIDCFSFGADDEWYDPVDITVSAETFASSGSYVLDLYWVDAGTLQASDGGYGKLLAEYDGDSNPFEDGEDNWVVCVYSNHGGWDDSACSADYSLDIVTEWGF